MLSNRTIQEAREAARALHRAGLIAYPYGNERVLDGKPPVAEPFALSRRGRKEKGELTETPEAIAERQLGRKLHFFMKDYDQTLNQAAKWANVRFNKASEAVEAWRSWIAGRPCGCGRPAVDIRARALCCAVCREALGQTTKGPKPRVAVSLEPA